MASTSRKIEIRVLPTVENLMLQVAMRDFEGNLSAYVRQLIYTDLCERKYMDILTVQVLKDADTQLK